MGMDLLAIEQDAFEVGWKGALKAVHVQAAAKDILSAELLALLVDLAALPPQIDEVGNAN